MSDTEDFGEHQGGTEIVRTSDQLPAGDLQQSELAKMPVMRLGIVPRTFNDTWRMAQVVYRSGAYELKSPEAAMVILMKGLELDIPPMAALSGIGLIEGKPALYGDLVMALIRRSKQLESFVETYEGLEQADGGFPDDFKAICTMKRRGEDPITAEYSVLDAKRAKLWGNEKRRPWILNPKRQMRFRSRHFASRDTFQDILLGMPIVEELVDMGIEPVDQFPPSPPKPQTPIEIRTSRQAEPPPPPVATTGAQSDPPADVVATTEPQTDQAPDVPPAPPADESPPATAPTPEPTWNERVEAFASRIAQMGHDTEVTAALEAEVKAHRHIPPVIMRNYQVAARSRIKALDGHKGPAVASEPTPDEQHSTANAASKLDEGSADTAPPAVSEGRHGFADDDAKEEAIERESAIMRGCKTTEALDNAWRQCQEGFIATHALNREDEQRLQHLYKTRSRMLNR